MILYQNAKLEEVMVLGMPKNFSSKFYEKLSNSCTHWQIESGRQGLVFWK
jgi:hypothetical protein